MVQTESVYDILISKGLKFILESLNRPYMVFAIGIAVMVIGFGVYFSEIETQHPKQLEGHYHQIEINDNITIGEKHG